MKAMIKRTGNTWLFVMKAFLFFAVLAIFFIGQNVFYQQTLFYYWGNYIVLLLYTANLYFTSKTYQSFNFGGANLPEMILSWTLCLVVTNVMQYLMLSLLELMLLPVTGFLIVLAAQMILVMPLTLMIDRLYYHINPAQKSIIIYGKAEKADEYREIIETHRKKFKIGKIASQDEPPDKLILLIKEAESVFFLDVKESIRENLLEYCYLHNKRTYILPTFSGVLLNTAGISWISNTPMFLPKSSEPDAGTRLIKRGIDVVVSLLAIITLSWLMILTWLAVRICDRGPAIYKQIRVTKGGKRFTLYKFRSMYQDAENDGIPRLTSIDDDRITPVGRFIRMTRIDELPQLFNVLSGAMSLVGPRPERPEIAKQYEEIYPNFAFRTKVKAGITGLAQIYGRYNTAPDEKLFLDIMYIETLSIMQDIKLLLQTTKVLFLPKSTEGVPNDSITALRKEEL
ncbi:MAG: exopolysaccharide biosynthesis polyprenyl glycosylphosphotransferase [Oscillospiraceae bacterium]|nr:exopolysaccharide biosynthesis polyprenyl glycosylphosphotransferase [Oscillospiraceae bacterium]